MIHALARDGREDEMAKYIAGMGSSSLIYERTFAGETALHFAAKGGHVGIVRQLLAHCPALIDQMTNDKSTPLDYAARAGRMEMVGLLLALKPQLAENKDENGRTALYWAAWENQREVAAHLLAKHPSLVDVVDRNGWPALFAAAAKNCASTLELLLPVTPNALHRRDRVGNVLLHLVDEVELVEKVWRMHPEALRVANREANTPFTLAARSSNWPVVELFQPKLTLDEILGPFECHQKERYNVRERLRTLVGAQCEVVLLSSLHPDVFDIVYEYLDLERAKTGCTAECEQDPSPPPPQVSKFMTLSLMTHRVFLTS